MTCIRCKPGCDCKHLNDPRVRRDRAVAALALWNDREMYRQPLAVEVEQKSRSGLTFEQREERRKAYQKEYQRNYRSGLR